MSLAFFRVIFVDILIMYIFYILEIQSKRNNNSQLTSIMYENCNIIPTSKSTTPNIKPPAPPIALPFCYTIYLINSSYRYCVTAWYR